MSVEEIGKRATTGNASAITAWVVYGMGSSAYILMIPTIGYAAYFHSQVVGNSINAGMFWALAVATALVITGVIAPFLGAYADCTGRKRQILTFLTVIACALTASLALVGRGDIAAGTALFVGAHVAFLLAKALYDSYLPALGPPQSLPGISGLAWGLGYLGCVAIFLLCLPLIAGGTEDTDPVAFRITFLITGIFFALLAVPSAMLLPADDAGRKTAGAYARVLQTLRNWRQHRSIMIFLAGYYLINDAIVTFLFFIGIYFKSDFGLSIDAILRLTLLFYAVGIPATIGFGWLGRVWSERGALNITLAIWLLLLAIMAVGQGPEIPLVIAIVAGLVIGSSQALCRSIYARLIPADRSAEFFGFNALVGRASAALGPVTFGLVTMATGSQRAAMASLAIFILLGGAILAFQKTDPPQHQAP